MGELSGSFRFVSSRRIASRRVSRWRAVVVEVCALAGGCEARAPDSSTSELDSVRLGRRRHAVVRSVERGRASERARRAYICSFVRAGGCVSRARCCCCCLRRGAERHDDGEGYCEWKTRPWLAGWLGGRRRGSVTAVRWRSRNSPTRLARVGQRRGVRALSVSLSRTTFDASVRSSRRIRVRVRSAARTYLPRESPSAPRLADMAS